MKKRQKILIAILTLVIALSTIFGMSACSNTVNAIDQTAINSKIEQLERELADATAAADKEAEEIQKNNEELKEQIAMLENEINALKGLNETDYVSQCYEKIKYIDKYLSDRDALQGENFLETQQWIKNNLIAAGYEEKDIEFQPITFSKYVKADLLDKYICKYDTDGKKYTREGRKYVEAQDGEFVYATFTTDNIVLKKAGKSDKQIIVGAHYDGDGTGDNGSGISLLLTVAQKLVKTQTPHNIVFIFFTAEEYGCYGSGAYADAMTQEEVDNTLYMINLDSLICGDYCYLYGGVQDDASKTVNKKGAFENAMNVAKSLGLEFKNNPWTYEQPAPGFEMPDYASPSTGDWSDHKGFKDRGIEYVYFEATNWEIPGPYAEYDGYGETYLIGMLMNTSNDYLEFIETYFPGRAQAHLDKFFKLLNALLVQNYQAAL